jgi:tRNA uridine 5-carboxymethylaminomethyl modification enzyme
VDKVVRFAEKTSHQIFLEPEGLDTREVYPNGISTSLPFDAQLGLVRSIRGLEAAHLTRPGYAIEYDFFDPRDLKPWLETRCIAGLFFAGQINGTTGYEEAAVQGIIAGVNAALRIRGREPWSPRRDEAYIGVLIDDLITRGTSEPYRMFTSRAEYRLLLREDNADLRLTEKGRELGLVDDERWRRFCVKREAVERERRRLESIRVQPGAIRDADFLAAIGGDLSRDQSLLELLRRPEVSYGLLGRLPEMAGAEVAMEVAFQVEVQARYHGYIERQETEIARNRGDEDLRLPGGLDYSRVRGLSAEVTQKLNQQRPLTLGQAARIPGVTPAAISLLRIHVRKASARR